jgi:hypothetical protein
MTLQQVSLSGVIICPALEARTAVKGELLHPIIGSNQLYPIIIDALPATVDLDFSQWTDPKVRVWSRSWQARPCVAIASSISGSLL